MMTIIPLAVLLATTATKAQLPITFDVASVKQNASGDLRRSTAMRGRTFTATNVSVRQLILVAYDLPSEPHRLIGGPEWIGTDRFDVVASTPETAKPSDSRLMIRSLLADRFRLAVHTEVREMPIFALTLARGDGRVGPQLRPSAPVDCAAVAAARRGGGAAPAVGDDPPCTSFVDDGVMRGHARTMATLATMLQRPVERAVIDRTGLGGNFDFELKFAPEGSAAANDVPSIYTALQEQLGLKLESTRGPVDVYVIDRIDRPSEN